jgi:hypothetical protein
MAWTTSRTPDISGGNFYIAERRILVESAANTLVVWRLNDWHGTTLPSTIPSDRGQIKDEVYQCGIALIAPTKLLTALQKAKRKDLSGNKIKNYIEKSTLQRLKEDSSGTEEDDGEDESDDEDSEEESNEVESEMDIDEMRDD